MSKRKFIKVYYTGGIKDADLAIEKARDEFGDDTATVIALPLPDDELNQEKTMPMINRPCRNRGCPNAQPCPDHPEDKAYNQHRGSSSSRGYDNRWQFVRRVKMSRDPLCERCEKLGRTEAAEMVHHIKPVNTHPELRLVMDNLMSLSNNCHEIVEGRKKDEKD